MISRRNRRLGHERTIVDALLAPGAACFEGQDIVLV